LIAVLTGQEGAGEAVIQVDIVARLPISANIDFELGQLVQEWEHLKMLKDMGLSLSAIAAAVLV
jgi:hypothetical protein